MRGVGMSGWGACEWWIELGGCCEVSQYGEVRAIVLVTRRDGRWVSNGRLLFMVKGGD